MRVAYVWDSIVPVWTWGGQGVSSLLSLPSVVPYGYGGWSDRPLNLPCSPWTVVIPWVTMGG